MSPGDQTVTFEAFHWLWWGNSLMSDEVVFKSDGTFVRSAYPDLFGKWAVRGCHLILNWDWWGSESLTTQDGIYFSKWDFSISTKDPPAWWLQVMEQCKNPEREQGPTRTEDVIWTWKAFLPKVEGLPMDDFPQDMGSVEDCKTWCGEKDDCIGFAANVDSESHEVKSWEPKKSTTGFDPETAHWLADKREDGESWQFHWKTDSYSLQLNDDGANFVLLCPPQLFQSPHNNFQCCQHQDGTGIRFNKDGTVNLEQLLVDEMSVTWNALQTSDGKAYHFKDFQDDVTELVGEAIWDQINPMPDQIQLMVIGLGLLSKLIGKGAGLKVFFAIIGKALTTYAHITHGFGIFLPLAALFKYAQHLHEWTVRALQHNKAMAALLFKSLCMQEVHFQQGSRYSGPLVPTTLKPEIKDICGDGLVNALRVQIPRTMQAMRYMFHSTEELAWCLRGGADGLGDDYRNGTKCYEQTLPILKGVEGRPGLLSAAVSAATMYGLETDALFVEGLEPNVKAYLRMSFNAQESDFLELDQLSAEQILDKIPAMTEEEKKTACASILVSQRSYEEVFKKLADAFPLWMSTFAVDDSQEFWATSPCKVVVNAMPQPGAAPAWDTTCLQRSQNRAYVGGVCGKGREDRKSVV